MKRFTALALIFTFISGQLASAQTAGLSLRVPGQFSISEKWGKIDEKFTGTNGKTVIYIQDAHDSLEAQNHIASLIKDLVEKQGVSTVLEEGYEGPVPTDSFFNFIPDSKIKEKVSYFLLDKLRIGGAEYAHINRKKDFKLVGADNIKLHLENIRKYREFSGHREQTQKDLAKLAQEIGILASQAFPKAMKKWLRSRQKFEAGEMNLLDYLQRTDAVLKKDVSRNWPVIELLLEAAKTDEVKMTEALKNINPLKLFEEISCLEDKAAEQWLSKPLDRQIFQYQRQIELLQRLSNIQISASEYESVKSTLASIQTRKIADFIAKQASKPVLLSRRWETAIQDAVAFYEIAHERNKAVSKSLENFLKSDEKTAVLVFGGFHREAIRDILKDQKVSFYVVTPKMSGADPEHQEFYKQLMSRGTYSFETPHFVKTAARAEAIFEMGLNSTDSFRRALTETIQRHPGLPMPLLIPRVTRDLETPAGIQMRPEVRIKPGAPLKKQPDLEKWFGGSRAVSMDSDGRFIERTEYLNPFPFFAKGEQNRINRMNELFGQATAGIDSMASDKHPGGIFQPSSLWRAVRAFRAAGIKPDQLIADLGHGDGRILSILAHLLDVSAVGAEWDTTRYRKSEAGRKIFEEKFFLRTNQVHFQHGDFNELDLSRADYVYYYSFGAPRESLDFERIMSQMKPGAKFILLGVKVDNEDFSRQTNEYQDFSPFLESGLFTLRRHPDLGAWIFTKEPARGEVRAIPASPVLLWTSDPDLQRDPLMASHLDKKNLSWHDSAGNSRGAEIDFQRLPYFVEEEENISEEEFYLNVFPSKDELRTNPALKILETNGRFQGLPAPGSFGNIVYRKAKWGETPVIWVRQIQSSAGFHMLSAEEKKKYGRWKDAALEALAQAAKEAGYQHVFVDSYETIRKLNSRTEGGQISSITPESLYEHYIRPFRGKWEKIKIPFRVQTNHLYFWHKDLTRSEVRNAGPEILIEIPEDMKFDFEGVSQEQTINAVRDFLTRGHSKNLKEILKKLRGGQKKFKDIKKVAALEFQHGQFLQIFIAVIEFKDEDMEAFILNVPARFETNQGALRDYRGIFKLHERHPQYVVKPLLIGTGNTGDTENDDFILSSESLHIFALEYLGDYVELAARFRKKSPNLYINNYRRQDEPIGRVKITGKKNNQRELFSQAFKILTVTAAFDPEKGTVGYLDDMRLPAGDFMLKAFSDGHFDLKLITVRSWAEDQSLLDFWDDLFGTRFLQRNPIWTLEGIARGLVEKFGRKRGEEYFRKWMKDYDRVLGERLHRPWEDRAPAITQQLYRRHKIHDFKWLNRYRPAKKYDSRDISSEELAGVKRFLNSWDDLTKPLIQFIVRKERARQEQTRKAIKRALEGNFDDLLQSSGILELSGEVENLPTWRAEIRSSPADEAAAQVMKRLREIAPVMNEMLPIISRQDVSLSWMSFEAIQSLKKKFDEISRFYDDLVRSAPPRDSRVRQYAFMLKHAGAQIGRLESYHSQFMTAENWNHLNWVNTQVRDFGEELKVTAASKRILLRQRILEFRREFEAHWPREKRKGRDDIDRLFDELAVLIRQAGEQSAVIVPAAAELPLHDDALSNLPLQDQQRIDFAVRFLKLVLEHIKQVGFVMPEENAVFEGIPLRPFFENLRKLPDDASEEEKYDALEENMLVYLIERHPLFKTFKATPNFNARVGFEAYLRGIAILPAHKVFYDDVQRSIDFLFHQNDADELERFIVFGETLGKLALKNSIPKSMVLLDRVMLFAEGDPAKPETAAATRFLKFYMDRLENSEAMQNVFMFNESLVKGFLSPAYTERNHTGIAYLFSGAGHLHDQAKRIAESEKIETSGLHSFHLNRRIAKETDEELLKRFIRQEKLDQYEELVIADSGFRASVAKKLVDLLLAMPQHPKKIHIRLLHLNDNEPRDYRGADMYGYNLLLRDLGRMPSMDRAYALQFAVMLLDNGLPRKLRSAVALRERDGKIVPVLEPADLPVSAEIISRGLDGMTNVYLRENSPLPGLYSDVWKTWVPGDALENLRAIRHEVRSLWVGSELSEKEIQELNGLSTKGLKNLTEPFMAALNKGEPPVDWERLRNRLIFALLEPVLIPAYAFIDAVSRKERLLAKIKDLTKRLESENALISLRARQDLIRIFLDYLRQKRNLWARAAAYEILKVLSPEIPDLQFEIKLILREVYPEEAPWENRKENLALNPELFNMRVAHDGSDLMPSAYYQTVYQDGRRQELLAGFTEPDYAGFRGAVKEAARRRQSIFLGKMALDYSIDFYDFSVRRRVQGILERYEYTNGPHYSEFPEGPVYYLSSKRSEIRTDSKRPDYEGFERKVEEIKKREGMPPIHLGHLAGQYGISLKKDRTYQILEKYGFTVGPIPAELGGPIFAQARPEIRMKKADKLQGEIAELKTQFDEMMTKKPWLFFGASFRSGHLENEMENVFLSIAGALIFRTEHAANHMDLERVREAYGKMIVIMKVLQKLHEKSLNPKTATSEMTMGGIGTIYRYGIDIDGIPYHVRITARHKTATHDHELRYAIDIERDKKYVDGIRFDWNIRSKEHRQFVTFDFPQSFRALGNDTFDLHSAEIKTIYSRAEFGAFIEEMSRKSKFPVNRAPILGERPEIRALAEKAQDLQIYQINARAYFKEKKIENFSKFTDRRLKKIAASGFNTIWLTGIWAESEASRKLNTYWGEKEGEKRAASAFAIPGYEVNPALGTEEQVRDLVRRANALGIRIMLDFIPNHFSKDSHLIDLHPDWFVHRKTPPPGGDEDLRYFKHELTGGRGTIWVAHGRDSYYPDRLPWTDAAQLNLLNPEVWDFMEKELNRISDLNSANGIRFDAIDAINPRYYLKLWSEELKTMGYGDVNAYRSYKPILQALKKRTPQFVSLGESFLAKDRSYWQQQGFDMLYAQNFYKRIFPDKGRTDWGWIKDFALSRNGKTRLPLLYLENHDFSSRVAEYVRRTLDKTSADDPDVLALTGLYASLIGTLSGVPLVYQGQEEGKLRKGPDAIRLRGRERGRPSAQRLYQKLFSITGRSAFRRGKPPKQIPFALESEEPSSVLAFKREGKEEIGIVVMNHSAEPVTVTLDFRQAWLSKKNPVITLQPWESRVWVVDSKNTEKILAKFSSRGRAGTVLSAAEKELIKKSYHGGMQREGTIEGEQRPVWIFGELDIQRPFLADLFADISAEAVGPEFYRDKKVLVAPGYGNLPFLLNLRGAREVVGMDLDPTTIAWQKLKMQLGPEIYKDLLMVNENSRPMIHSHYRNRWFSYLNVIAPYPEIDGLSFETGSILNPIPYANREKYDLIVVPYLFGFTHGLETREQWNKALENMKNALASGGRIILIPGQIDIEGFNSGEDRDMIRDYKKWLEDLDTAEWDIHHSHPYPFLNLTRPVTPMAGYTVLTARSEIRSKRFERKRKPRPEIKKSQPQGRQRDRANHLWGEIKDYRAEVIRLLKKEPWQFFVFRSEKDELKKAMREIFYNMLQTLQSAPDRKYEELEAKWKGYRNFAMLLAVLEELREQRLILNRNEGLKKIFEDHQWVELAGTYDFKWKDRDYKITIQGRSIGNEWHSPRVRIQIHPKNDKHFEIDVLRIDYHHTSAGDLVEFDLPEGIRAVTKGMNAVWHQRIFALEGGTHFREFVKKLNSRILSMEETQAAQEQRKPSIRNVRRSEIRHVSALAADPDRQIFENKRIFVDYRDIISDEQIKEIIYTAQQPHRNVQVLISNVNQSEKLGKLFESLRSDRLIVKPWSMEEMARKYAKDFRGEVIVLAGSRSGIQAQRLKQQLKEAAGIHELFILGYEVNENGSLGVALRDLENRLLRHQDQTDEIVKPVYMDLQNGILRVTDRAQAGVDSWQHAYDQALVVARNA